MANIKIHAAYARSRHVRHGQISRLEGPTSMNHCRIGNEANTHSGCVMTERPNRRPDHVFRTGWQPVIERFGIVPCFALNANFRRIIPVDVVLAAGTR